MVEGYPGNGAFCQCWACFVFYSKLTYDPWTTLACHTLIASHTTLAYPIPLFSQRDTTTNEQSQRGSGAKMRLTGLPEASAPWAFAPEPAGSSWRASASPSHRQASDT